MIKIILIMTLLVFVLHWKLSVFALAMLYYFG